MKNLNKVLAVVTVISVAVFLFVGIGAISAVEDYTSAMGEVRFDDLALGEYEIIISKPGYYSKTVSTELLALEGQNNVTLNVELEEILSGSISAGTITDTDGAAIDGVTLTVDGYSDLSNMPAGSYDVKVSKSGYYSRTVTVEVVFLEGQEHVLVSTTLTAITSGTATIVTKDGDNILPGATVTINGEQVISNENGEAVFTLPIGTHEILIEKDGYYHSTGSITLEAVEGLDVAATDVELTRITTGSLTITVKDNNGSVLQGVSVEIRKKD